MHERERGSDDLRSIHIDLEERSIILETGDDTAFKLSLSGGQISYELLGRYTVTRRYVDELVSKAVGLADAAPDEATESGDSDQASENVEPAESKEAAASVSPRVPLRRLTAAADAPERG